MKLMFETHTELVHTNYKKKIDKTASFLETRLEKKEVTILNYTKEVTVDELALVKKKNIWASPQKWLIVKWQQQGIWIMAETYPSHEHWSKIFYSVYRNVAYVLDPNMKLFIHKSFQDSIASLTEMLPLCNFPIHHNLNDNMQYMHTFMI